MADKKQTQEQTAASLIKDEKALAAYIAAAEQEKAEVKELRKLIAQKSKGIKQAEIDLEKAQEDLKTKSKKLQQAQDDLKQAEEDLEAMAKLLDNAVKQIEAAEPKKSSGPPTVKIDEVDYILPVGKFKLPGHPGETFSIEDIKANEVETILSVPNEKGGITKKRVNIQEYVVAKNVVRRKGGKQ